MKKIKKIFSVFFASILCILPYNERCSARRLEVLLSENQRSIRLLDTKTLDQKIEEIKRHIGKGYTVEILDGGSYYNTARANGYECHHLVSSHFCGNHPNVLSRSQAPAVLIPKELHQLTGSHPCSGFMNDYLKREEEVFARRNSIHDVAKLGMEDLIRAVKLYYREKSTGKIDIRSADVATQTPVKRAFEQVQILSPLKSPLTPSKFFSPIKNADSSRQTDEEDEPLVCPCTPLKSRKFRSRLSVANATPVTSSSSSNGWLLAQ